MSNAHRADVWAIGEAYETYVGRWSRPVAREFIDWLALPPQGRWVDLGCGTGSLTQTILAHAEPASVIGIDPSEGFLTHARTQTHDQRARFQLGSADALPLTDSGYDAIVAGLVLNFVPHPEKAVAEMRRILRPGGIAAAYVWDYAGGMQLMRCFWNAAVALDPAARALDEARRFPICNPESLLKLFADGGFDRTECRSIDVPTVFKDFDDYWLPFLGGQGPAPTYCSALTEERRAALRGQLRLTLPIEDDGSIRMIARAWAVRGIRPD
ncbi:MAG: methyltransferase domain-containing protein [Rhizobiales bacterium]|nr:methyltransferase domain-containing protein [Hyphomicrobiales bacterium]